MTAMRNKKITAILLMIAIIICVLLFKVYANRDSTSTSMEPQGTPVITMEEVDNTFDIVEDFEYYTEMVSEHFELSINGATGFASSNMRLQGKPKNGSEVIKNLKAGTAFTLIEDCGDYIKVVLEDGTEGYVFKKYIMINLPDVIPSIVYACSNSESAMYRSSKVELPGITGEMLYNVKAENQRFDEEQYVMPIMYTAALKIQAVQTAALANGDSLKIYETYRPYETQKAIVSSLNKLINSNEEVEAGINEGAWQRGWFIAQGTSNHQKGLAMDCSLVRVEEAEINECGNYEYLKITKYEEYEMPTEMHELSPAAKIYTKPFSSSALRKGTTGKPSTGMLESEGAQKLQQYCVEQGLTPLSSEWWHFDDWSSYQGGSGKFFIFGGNNKDESGNYLEVVNTTSKVPN